MEAMAHFSSIFHKDQEEENVNKFCFASFCKYGMQH
jgi:hypothetical protein